MRSVFRSIVAVVVGFIVASVVMLAIESFNGKVLYPDLGKMAEGVTDREAIRALLAAAPTGAFLVVIAAWAIGGWIGGMVTGWIGGAQLAVRLGVVLGGLLVVAGIANNLMMPPPSWFWIASLVVLVPAAYLGARTVQPKH